MNTSSLIRWRGPNSRRKPRAQVAHLIESLAESAGCRSPEQMYQRVMKLLSAAKSDEKDPADGEAGVATLAHVVSSLEIPDCKRAAAAARTLCLWPITFVNLSDRMVQSLRFVCDDALQYDNVSPVLSLNSSLISRTHLQKKREDSYRGNGQSNQVSAGVPLLADPQLLARRAAANESTIADAQALAESHSEFAHLLVDELLARNRSKHALRIAKSCELDNRVPPIRMNVKLDSVADYCKKGKLSVLCFLIRTEPDIVVQQRMFDCLLEYLPSMVSHGAELMDAADLLSVSDETLHQLASRANLPLDEPENCLKLDVPIVMADNRNKLRDAAQRLRASPSGVIGLDAEWRPTRVSRYFVSHQSFSQAGDDEGAQSGDSEAKTPISFNSADDRADTADTATSDNSARVALLQLATDREAVLVDTLNLSQQDIEEELGDVFQSDQLVKVGFEVKEDTSRLQEALPDVPSAQSLSAIVDLKTMWGLAMGTSAPKGGLSGLCKATLGKHLAKGMQMSDWERRPLSRRQASYAALDAVACERIYRKLEYRRLRAVAKPPLGVDSVRKAAEPYSRIEVRELSSDERDWKRGMGGRGRSASAATSSGVAADRVAKAVGFIKLPEAEGQREHPVLAILPGDRQVRTQRLAWHLEANNASSVRLASEAEVVDHFGFRPGTVSPIGTRQHAIVVADSGLSQAGSADIVAGAGCEMHELRGPAEDIIHAAKARVARLADSSPPVEAGEDDGDGDQIKRNYKFVLDGGLGRLARWLRALGLDTEYVSSERKSAHVPKLKRMCELEGRVLVTGSKALIQWADQSELRRAVRVESDHPQKQLAEVTLAFPISDVGEQLTRCTCNGIVGTSESLLTEEQAKARHDVPEWVANDRTVWVCMSCGKAFWSGPKTARALSLVNKLTENAVFHATGGNAVDGDKVYTSSSIQGCSSAQMHNGWDK